MSGNTKTVRVTNQGELDEALKAEPSNDMVIVIDSNPGRYFPIYIIVADSRGHWIEARGESRVIAAGKARLTAWDRSMVEAQEEAVVHATDYAKVNWHDKSSGECGHNARGEAWDRATVTTLSWHPLFAHDNAQVTARGTSRVVANYAASVTAYNQSVVEMTEDVDVTAYNQAVVYCKGGEVYAHDHVTVYVGKGADRPSVEGVPTVVVHDFKGDTPVRGGVIVVPSDRGVAPAPRLSGERQTDSLTPTLSARLRSPAGATGSISVPTKERTTNMTKRKLVAPPVGTMYRVSYYSQNHNKVVEYWQVERRTEKTVWLRRLVTDAEGKPVPGMIRTDIPLLKRRVLQDACLCIHKGVYVDLYRDIYRPTN